MSRKIPADYVRAMIETKGWGQLGAPREPEAYSADPIEIEPETEGTRCAVDPNNLTDEQEQLVADCFKVVAAFLVRDDAGTYAALLEALMEGGE